jgi:hypothetical protein
MAMVRRAIAYMEDSHRLTARCGGHPWHCPATAPAYEVSKLLEMP